MTGQSRESSTTPFVAAFLALFAEQEDRKNGFEVLTIENRCIPGLVAEAKKLQKKLDDRKEDDVASKSTHKSQMKQAAAADERVATLKTELANAKALHSRLVVVVARSEADADKACSGLQDSQARLIDVEQKAKLAREDLAKEREQFSGSANAAEKALR